MRSRRRAGERDFDGGPEGGSGRGDGGRHRLRRRRRRREGRDYIELPGGEEKPKEDPLEQRSIALVVLFFVVVILAVCVSIIMKSVEVEVFPEM